MEVVIHFLGGAPSLIQWPVPATDAGDTTVCLIAPADISSSSDVVAICDLPNGVQRGLHKPYRSCLWSTCGSVQQTNTGA